MTNPFFYDLYSSMEFLNYNNHVLSLGLKQKSLWPLAENYISPAYIYDLDFIADRAQKLQSAFKKPVEIFYAVKANSNSRVIQTLAKSGCGADVVSLGEIERAEQSGISPRKMVYSGVGKTYHEIKSALTKKIYQINVESIPELLRIIEIVKASPELGPAPVALRINPDVDIKTHPYIATGLRDNKFGMEISALTDLKNILKSSPSEVQLVGLSMHLGSQMLELDGFDEALGKMKAIFLDLQKDFSYLQRFDFGGGLGVIYDRSDLLQEYSLLETYAAIIHKHLHDVNAQLQTEPGRWLVAHAGVILTQIQYVKKTQHKNFLIVDTGMHHLMRPSLYQAQHRILPLRNNYEAVQTEYDIAGPICESADFLGKKRLLPELQSGDFLVIADAGAYGFTMSNNYNLQTPAMELFI